MDKRVWTNLQMAQSQGGQAVNIIDQIADDRDKAQQENKQLKERIKRLEGNIEKLKDAGDLVFIWLLYNRSHIGGLDVDSALREWKQSKKEVS